MESTAAPVPIDELLAQRAWLRRIARALVGDSQTADDLVQEVWLAALERPPRRRGSLRSWLATVLRRKAIDRSRAAGRRALREAGRGRPRPSPPADELLAEIEMHRRVTDAVLALEEPYRSTLLLRYVGARSVAEVARLQGAPVATVRTRLKRGLAQLRRRLDAEHGGRRGAWMAILAPIAWPDRTYGFSTGTMATAVGGGIVGGKITAWAGGILLLLLVTWAGIERLDSGIDTDRTGGNAGLEGAAAAPAAHDDAPTLRGHPGARTADAPQVPWKALATAARASAPRAEDLPFTAEAEPPKETVVRIVVPGGEVSSGYASMRRAGGQDSREGEAATFPIRRDGTVRVPLTRTTFLDVQVPGRQERTLHLSKRDTDEPVDVVFGTGEVYGVVRDEHGEPAVGVGVSLSSYLERTDEGWAPTAEGHVFAMATRTDGEGAYRFTGLPVGTFALVATRRRDDPAAERNIRSVQVTLDAGEYVQVDFGGVDVEPILSGVLRYTDGVPVCRALNMFLTAEEGGGRLYVRTNAQGRFSKRVPPGAYGVEMVIGGGLSAAGWLGARLVPTAQRVVVVDEYTPPQDITFPGTRLDGHVRGHAGTDDQVVRAHLVEPEGETPVSRITKQPVNEQRACVGKDGSFLLDGLSPGLWRLTGTPRAIRPMEVHAGARQPVLVVEVELTGD